MNTYYDTPERNIYYEDLDIIDSWVDGEDVYFTVDIGDSLMVDVIYPRLLTRYPNLNSKIPFDSNFSYIVNCDETGSEIYNRDLYGNFRPLQESEYNDIIEYVDDNALDFIGGV